MIRIKQIVVVLFLTIFVVSTMTSIAMAYCGSGLNGITIEKTSGDGAHHQVDTMDDDSKTSNYHNSTDKSNDSSNCFNCDGNFCHSQSLAPVHHALGLYEPTGDLHVENDLNLKQIFLTRIPQPPKQLSQVL